jgi:hypothetical protein
MWKRWYHVVVEVDGRRHRIAIEATSAIEARQRVAADWGDDRVLEIRGAR